MFKKINWQLILDHKIISGVIASLIAAGILSFISWIFGDWSWVKSVWSFLFNSVSIPIWLLVILVILSLCSLLRFFVVWIRMIIVPWRKYKEDLFDGIRWRWEYRGKNAINLFPHCPVDNNVLDYPTVRPSLGDLRNPTTTFICKTCDNRWIFNEKYKDIEERICRQINGNNRSGKWKQLVEKKRKAAT